MLAFLDRHLAATGLTICGGAGAVFVLVLLFAPDTGRPLFGSEELAITFLIATMFLCALGFLLFLLGITRTHLDPPFASRHDRERA